MNKAGRAKKWAMHYAAAHQFYELEGHLTVPRKHVETVLLGGEGGDQEQREVSLKFGAWSATSAPGSPR